MILIRGNDVEASGKWIAADIKSSDFADEIYFDSIQEIDYDDWRLILVNFENPIPSDFNPELVALDNGQRVDVRIFEPLTEMLASARSQGLYMEVNSGFRCVEQQQYMFDYRMNYWMATGLDHQQAFEKTTRLLAYPGTSEHHLGLAVDILGEENWVWLRENSPNYGFILRYPEGSGDITGVAYEPWHFRYVGIEFAIEITSRGITLEEFLGRIP